MKSWWLFSFSQAQARLKACENEKSLNTPEAYWLLLKASLLGMAVAQRRPIPWNNDSKFPDRPKLF
jgi:hypothetical protein